MGTWLWEQWRLWNRERWLEVHAGIDDGWHVKSGQVVLSGQGAWADVLLSERLLLNVMSALSGMATRTEDMVRRARATNPGVEITGTRKTPPLWRDLARHAVVCGGGSLHRANLSSGVLFKENHLRPAGGVTAALAALRKVRVEGAEIELASPEDLKTLQNDVVRHGFPESLGWIMLDNFSPQEILAAVRSVRTDSALRKIKVEASGGIGPDNIAAFAATGVDRISSGWLTHSVRALDFSLQVYAL